MKTDVKETHHPIPSYLSQKKKKKTIYTINSFIMPEYFVEEKTWTVSRRCGTAGRTCLLIKVNRLYKQHIVINL